MSISPLFVSGTKDPTIVSQFNNLLTWCYFSKKRRLCRNSNEPRKPIANEKRTAITQMQSREIIVSIIITTSVQLFHQPPISVLLFGCCVPHHHNRHEFSTRRIYEYINIRSVFRPAKSPSLYLYFEALNTNINNISSLLQVPFYVYENENETEFNLSWYNTAIWNGTVISQSPEYHQYIHSDDYWMS
jgi:hypothetical protein